MDKENKKIEIDAELYAGVAVDIADNEEVTDRLVKQDTCKLENNPRNNDIDE